MSRRKDWDKVAKAQFESLDADIRDDWSELYNKTTAS
jgi:hypothetical protein